MQSIFNFTHSLEEKAIKGKLGLSKDSAGPILIELKFVLVFLEFLQFSSLFQGYFMCFSLKQV